MVETNHPSTSNCLKIPNRGWLMSQKSDLWVNLFRLAVFPILFTLAIYGVKARIAPGHPLGTIVDRVRPSDPFISAFNLKGQFASTCSDDQIELAGIDPVDSRELRKTGID